MFQIHATNPKHVAIALLLVVFAIAGLAALPNSATHEKAAHSKENR